MVAEAVAAFALVLIERDGGRADEAAVAGHDDAGMRRLAAELVDDVGALAPVGINEQPVDGEGRTVVAVPTAVEQLVATGLQAGIDGALQSGTRLRSAEGVLEIPKGEI
jgi:hypothetical protein